MADLFIKDLQGDPVTMANHQIGQGCRKKRGIIEFRHIPMLVSHGGTAIEENMTLHIGFLLKGSQEVSIRTGIDAPIHKCQIVAVDILSIVVKLNG